jgi:copper chaperone CopZ
MMTPGTTRTVLMIAGMRDNACRQKIAEALESMPGVQDVDVSLHRSRATIVHEPPCVTAKLMLTIERSGYAAEQVVEGRRNGLGDK